ncbi:hypothetical protein TSUD_92460 [Trifolium subterraneum]|uniref:Uncharacterized protein n=1 Tax=Trifolium subterraneum TaxID=3900 RepID=A0A2Z6PF47_TRISU|nr:hypothetical protein TSUD_92460 [Trifolium subterraneum]
MATNENHGTIFEDNFEIQGLHLCGGFGSFPVVVFSLVCMDRLSVGVFCCICFGAVSSRAVDSVETVASKEEEKKTN